MTLEDIKDFSLSLNEELKYHDSVIEHKKNLETTLWGLEEQAGFPENSANLDQNELVEGINRCQLKIMTCNKLLITHEKKLISFINNFKGQEDFPTCSSKCGG